MVVAEVVVRRMARRRAWVRADEPLRRWVVVVMWEVEVRLGEVGDEDT
jgi:hypothetical protein